MTIEKAIAEAKANGAWINDKPTSVNVGYACREGFICLDDESETQFDLYENHEEDLINLWHQQYDESGSTLDGVLYVEALGYVAD